MEQIIFENILDILILLPVVIGTVIYFLRKYFRNEQIRQKEEQKSREQEIKENERATAISKQQAETRKKIQELDKKYNKLINCPICNGNGETYITTSYLEEPDDGNLRLTRVIPLESDIQQARKTGFSWKRGPWLERMDKVACPYCQGTGSAYAYFETKTAWSEVCTTCKGNGKLTVKEKLEIGVGQKQVNCSKCQGTGKITHPAIPIVHVKTKSGSEEELQQEGTRLPSSQFGQYPSRFYIEITDENRNFYSKSKPIT